MDGAALLLRPPGLEIERIDAGATALTVSVTLRLPTSTCPRLGDERHAHSQSKPACRGRCGL